jgi:hypothetical protein
MELCKCAFIRPGPLVKKGDLDAQRTEYSGDFSSNVLKWLILPGVKAEKQNGFIF